jgi:ribonuclease D
MSPLWIDTAAALAEACARWQSREWIALDTEFVRIDTYHARLCLVQVGDGETDACIDTLALEDLSPLWALLQAPGVLKLLHSSSQDLEIFVERTGQTGGPIFDTQIAATLLGYGDQIGYAALVERCLGETVDKSLSRTDWARRPLKAAEIAYAADDVRHLAALYPALREAVTAAGRLPWLEADCAALTDPARYRTAPDDAWQRLNGLGRLARTAGAAAQPAAALDTRRRRALPHCRTRADHAGRARGARRAAAEDPGAPRRRAHRRRADGSSAARATLDGRRTGG